MSMKKLNASLNHRLKADGNSEAGPGSSFQCECADLRCNATLDLTREERSRSRSSSTRFWVRPGHELEREMVVETNARYCIVLAEAG